MEEDLVYRLLKRAEIRRQITTRKSVQEGKPDRIADLLEEAAEEIKKLKNYFLKDIENESWKKELNSYSSLEFLKIANNIIFKFFI